MKNRELIKKVIRTKMSLLNSLIDLLPENIGGNIKSLQEDVIEAICEYSRDCKKDESQRKDAKIIKPVQID